MSKLLPITIISILLTVLSHRASGYDPIECRYERKERFFYTIMAISLILFAGLRTWYNDTHTYRNMYKAILEKRTEYTSLTEGIEWLELGNNPGFVFTMRLLARMNVSVQSFIMLFSAFTIGVNLWFFRKYSCNLWLSVVLFITYAGYTFNLAAIKQCTAMAFCLLATDKAINRKYVGFLIYVLLASLFHAYALMYLMVPLLFFRPWSKYTVLMLVFFGIAGISMQFLVGTLLNVTDMLGEEYNAASFTGEGVNPIRLLVTSVPLVLSVLTAKQIAETEERDQYVILNLAMLNSEIMFVGLFGTANYFARLANYFIPFQAVAIPWLFKKYDYRSRTTLTIFATIGYSLFFIYSNVISSPFDSFFVKMKLWDYLKTLFEGVFA